MRIIAPSLLILFLFMGHCVGDDFHLGQVPSPNGAQVLSFDTWTQMSFVLRNDTDTDKEILVTSFFDMEPDQQYGKRLLVPAHSNRTSWSLVKSPAGGPESSSPVPLDLQTLVLEQDGENEKVVATESGRRQHAHHNRYSNQASRTLLIRSAEDQHIIPFLEAVKLRESDNYQDIVQGLLPETALAYDGFTHVVLATSRIELNLEALNALRDWVSGGGNLWIHLDRTGPGLLDHLLTHSANLSPVDEIELNSFQVETPPLSPISAEGTRILLETPLRMLRTIQHDCEVLASIDGWPAALILSQGSGRILITTIEPQAFFHRPTIGEVAARSRPRATRVGETLGGYFFFTDTANVPETPDWPQLSSGFIGHQIPSKWMIGGILSAFCLVLVWGSIWARRSQGYGQLSFRFPLTAVVTAGILALLGASSRSGIPSTRASIQYVQADRQGNLLIEGAESTYTSEAGDGQILLDEVGRLEFVGKLPGAAKRYVFNDSGVCSIENVRLPAGSHTATFNVQRSTFPTSALLTFGESGLTGRLTGMHPDVETQGLLVMPGGKRCQVHIDREGRLSSGPEDVLRGGEYFKANMVNDRQRLQMSVYETWLGGARGLPDQPGFYFWTDPLELQAKVAETSTHVGDALVSVPVEIHHPEPGTKVYIPSPCVHYRTYVHPQWGNSTVFDNRTRRWNESTAENAYSGLKCSVPHALAPMDIQKMQFSIELRTPNRDVTVTAERKDGTSQEVARFHSPIGRKTIMIDDTDLFSDDPENILVLLIHVGPLTSSVEELENGTEFANSANSGWKIQSIEMEGWAISR